MLEKKFSYRLYVFFIGGLILLLYIFTFLLWLSILGIISGMMIGEIEIGLSSMGQVLGFFGFSILFIRSMSIAINMYPEILIEEDGIRVRLFNFVLFWRLITWKQIGDIWESPRKAEGYDAVIIDTNQDLTVWHKHLSRVWGNGIGNQIVLRETMIDREELLNHIEKRIVRSH